MAREKKQAAGEKEQVVEKSVEELMLNMGDGKYGAVGLVSMWASELHRREENKHLTQVELLDLAMKEVLGGVVSHEDILKTAAHAAKLAAQSETSKEKK